MDRGPTVEIDLSALAFNLKEVKRIAGVPVIAVVKADAYGHGAVEASKTFQRHGAYALAVAFSGEALALREAGIRSPILALFEREDIKGFFTHRLTPVLHDLKTARAISKEASKRGLRLDVHLKADTGMGRMGFEDPEALYKAAVLPGLKVTGLLSHFSESDISDSDYMKLQLGRLKAIRDGLRRLGLKPLCHMANSAALIGFPESRLDAVRPGLLLYGCPPAPPAQFSSGLPAPISQGLVAPAMKVTTKVLALKRLKKGAGVSYGRTFITTRPTLTAVLPVGYADGYMRALSNRSYVILRGKRAPVIGRVCMDLAIVDVTDIKNVKEGDKAILLGREMKGSLTPLTELSISPWEIAKEVSTIPYEVLTSFGRARRVFVNR